jgi:hypothetical protein
MKSPIDATPAPLGASPAARLNPGVGWFAVLAAAGWCFWADAPTLNDRTGYGPAEVLAAQVGYGLIAARAGAAVVLRDRSRVWAVYAVLLLAIGPLIILIVHLAPGR